MSCLALGIYHVTNTGKRGTKVQPGSGERLDLFLCHWCTLWICIFGDLGFRNELNKAWGRSLPTELCIAWVFLWLQFACYFQELQILEGDMRCQGMVSGCRHRLAGQALMFGTWCWWLASLDFSLLLIGWMLPKLLRCCFRRLDTRKKWKCWEVSLTGRLSTLNM